MKVRVVINGTDENRWHKLGLRGNPFPPIASADPVYQGANRILCELDAEPIETVDKLKRILDGCTPEFIDLCVKAYEPGKRVAFEVEFPRP